MLTTNPIMMSEFKPKETSSTLLASGKSSRLLDMRNKSQNPSPATTTAQPHSQQQVMPTDPALPAELRLAQEIIDQQITLILAGLPAGKQRSFFRIRYGMDIDTLKQQSIDRIVKLLKINHLQLTQARGDIKQILQLTYYGRPSP